MPFVSFCFYHQESCSVTQWKTEGWVMYKSEPQAKGHLKHCYADRIDILGRGYM